MSSVPGAWMAAEIAEQPDVLARGLEELERPAREIARALDRARVEMIVVAARGSSDNAGRYAKYLLGLATGRFVADEAPSLLTVYGVRPHYGRAAALGISQSGQAADVLAVVAAGRDAELPTIGITNDPDSPLATAADHVLVLPAGRERSVPATKTYTSTLLALALLAAGSGTAAARAHVPRAALARLPETVAAVLARADAIEPLAAALAVHDRCLVLGRGLNRGTAAEIALKIQETSRLSAQDFGASDVLHGPLAVVGPGFPVVMAAAEGPTEPALRRAAIRVVELGGELTILGHGLDPAGLVPQPAAGAGLVRAVALPSDLPEALSPFPLAVAGQVFALRVALRRGLDPDRPPALSKVTITR